MTQTDTTEQQNPSLILRVWYWLVEPTAPNLTYEARLKSRWLTMMIILLMPFSFVAGLGVAILTNTPLLESAHFLGVLFLIATSSIMYFLARRGRYEAGAVVGSFLTVMVVFLIVALERVPQDIRGDVNFLVISIWFSSVLLSGRITTIVLFVNIIGLLLLPLWKPVPILEIIRFPFTMVIVMYTLIWFGRLLRDQLETHHLNTLQEENRERRLAEERLRTLLTEKEVLLKEIHHRVKNNLQIISSLLSLQSNRLTDTTIRGIFQDSQNRVLSMALIHERLYRSDDLVHIDFADYLRDLTENLKHSHRHQGIYLNIETDEIFLDIETAIPCGLLVHELVSNSLKHAFKDGRRGEVNVEMRHMGGEQYHLKVRDNGVGLPEDMDLMMSDSLGLQLVNSLTLQLNGTIEMHSRGGTCFEIVFGDLATATSSS